MPYKHTVAAVRDGLIWRTAGNLAAYIVINTKNSFVRFRYLHMNPNFMDTDGVLSGRQVSEGEIIGKVATWGDHENGTSYHLHFNIQVFTKVGWVWVNPYMTLVLAYERQIGGRGTEIKPGDPVPAVPAKPPLIEHPPPVPVPPVPPGTETSATQADTAPAAAKPADKKAEKTKKKSGAVSAKKRRHIRRKRRHR